MGFLRFCLISVVCSLLMASVHCIHAAEEEGNAEPPSHFDDWIFEGGSDVAVFEFARDVLLAEPLVVDAVWLAERDGSPDLPASVEGDLLVEGGLGIVYVQRDLSVGGDMLIGPGTELQAKGSVTVDGNLISVESLIVEDSLSVGEAINIGGGGLFAGRHLNCLRSTRVTYSVECDGDVQAASMFIGDKLLVKGKLNAELVDAEGVIGVGGDISCREIIGLSVGCGGSLTASEFVHALRGAIRVGGDLSCASVSAGIFIAVKGVIDCSVAIAAGTSPFCLSASGEPYATVSCSELRSGKLLLGRLELEEANGKNL